MRACLNFSKSKDIWVNNQIYPYADNILDKLRNITDLFIITTPGSYNGIRKSIAIAEAVKLYNNCELYGVNLLTDIGPLLTNKNILFYDGPYKYFFCRKLNKVFLNPEFELSNYEDTLDWSTNNIVKYLNNIQLNPLLAIYYDKFNY